MTVDFGLVKSPRLRVATIAWSGPWNEAKIRAQFRRVERWARAQRVRTGRWVFREPGERRWAAGIELLGKAKGSGGIRVRTLPAVTVARVVFDPEAVAPRLVYHGLSDWLRWRRRDKTIRAVVSTREIYPGDPWTDRKAWARTEVQFVVRK
jgi:DNA gyrase inhibitor GyrI